MAGATSATSPVDICNGALQMLGAKFISSITGGDSSQEATQCAQCYYDMVDEVLAENDWSFARKRAVLNQLNVTLPYIPFNSQVSIVYAYPSDFIKAWKKSSQWAKVQLLGPYIISDNTGLGIQYTFKNYNVATYFPKFKTALMTRVAAQIAFSITNSVKKAADIRQQYVEIDLPTACAEDSQQGDAPTARQDEWESSMFTSGSVALVGVSGQGVWFPIE